jgi:hypothetical protein
MLIRGNSDIVQGSIVDPDGNVVNKPTQVLTTEEAELLRRYKKFLASKGMREAVYCNACFEGDLSDGMRAFVTDGQILFECRHRMLFYQGQTF